MLRTLSDSFLSIIYPQECRVCGGEVESSDDGVACSGCWSATRIFTGNETLCSKCGAFLFEARSFRTSFCRKCDDQSYDKAFAVGSYEKALSATVLHLKRNPHISPRLRHHVSETLGRFSIQDSTLVIPVPLSARRLQERGFNQASVIGRLVSKHLRSPYDESTLIRKAHTPMHRVGMDRKARANTVKNAFQVVRPKLIQDMCVLLVDDIFTSGETASYCAEILKKNGAARVDVLTLARAA